MVTIPAFPEGDRRTVDLDGTPVTVFNLGDRYVAYVDRCLHQRGPVCSAGTLHPLLTAAIEPDGEVREYFADGSRVIACPWHGWEYDLETGEALWNRARRLRPARVEVDGGDLRVSL
ncbi:MAG TPA: Rieske 2Fe-2S domain-containing protein [Solirubrobacter sp.]|jgi:nitrite reductase/ring-hydroxylating ferredoxin subunit|nr:Rieske 2Fe-2S domain-containing protein [Solirubrobacter sp.]